MVVKGYQSILRAIQTVIGVLAYTPPLYQMDAGTGDVTRPYKGLDVDDDEVILEPSDAPDFNWSPL